MLLGWPEGEKARAGYLLAEASSSIATSHLAMDGIVTYPSIDDLEGIDDLVAVEARYSTEAVRTCLRGAYDSAMVDTWGRVAAAVATA